MQKILSKCTKLNKFFVVNFVLFFFFLFLPTSMADNFKKFEIVGNKSINKEIILSYLEKNKKSFDLNDLNQFKKDLYQTNFFSNVNIKIVEQKVVVTVVENPLIDYFFIFGIKNKDLIKKINGLVSLKSNNFFSEVSVKKDVVKISSFLSSLGYFDSNIDYLVKKNSDNRVNIFYNVTLNKKFKINNIFFIGDKYFSSSVLSDVISSSRSSLLSFSDSTIPSKERANFDKSLLKKFYLARGFYDAQISDVSIEVESNNYANLTYVINSGQKFTIEKINFTDNTISTLSENNLKDLNQYMLAIENKYYDPGILKNLNEKITQYFEINNIPVDLNFNLIKNSNTTLFLNIFFSKLGLSREESKIK